MDKCLFCKIVDKEIPAHIIVESEKSLAFMDINPISDGHILVIPKKHSKNLSSAEDADLIDLILLTKKVAKELNYSSLDNWGINYLSNEEPVAGQEVMHLHIHVIPKYSKNEGLKFSVENRKINNIEKIKKLLNK